MPDYKNPLVPKKQKTPTYAMTDAAIEDIRRQARADGVDAGMRRGVDMCNAIYSVVMLSALRDQLGFGQKRLARMFELVQKRFSEIAEHRIVYTDLAQMLLDECHINLTIESVNGGTKSALDFFEDIQRPAKIQLEVRKK